MEIVGIDSNKIKDLVYAHDINVVSMSGKSITLPTLANRSLMLFIDPWRKWMQGNTDGFENR